MLSLDGGAAEGMQAHRIVTCDSWRWRRTRRRRRTVGPIHASARTTSIDETLQAIDKALQRDDERTAVELATAMAEQGKLRGFGKSQLVPKRSYSLAELKLNKIDTTKFLAPVDTIVESVTKNLLLASVAAVAASAYYFHLELRQVLGVGMGYFFFKSVDQVANAGGVEALLIDTAVRVVEPKFARRVAEHEAGHFLIAYLVGILPKNYTLSSLDVFRKFKVLNVQAGTLFCDEAFQKEVASGKLSSASLDRYCCVALAGVSTEYIRYGHAEGGTNDVQQLDATLRALRFSQKKADDQVRWSVLNTVELLRRHDRVHASLVDAMMAGKSVGSCIAVVEDALEGVQFV